MKKIEVNQKEGENVKHRFFVVPWGVPGALDPGRPGAPQWNFFFVDFRKFSFFHHIFVDVHGISLMFISSELF